MGGVERLSCYKRVFLAGFAFLGLLICFSVLREVQAAERTGKRKIAIIVSPKWHSVEALDLRDLKMIFLGKKTSIDEVPVVPVNRRRGMAVRRAFDELVMGMTERQVREYWIAEQLKGGARPPLELGLLTSLLSKVGHKVGAMSYVFLDELRPRDKERVKILKVIKDGKTYGIGDEKYPLIY